MKMYESPLMKYPSLPSAKFFLTIVFLQIEELCESYFKAFKLRLKLDRFRRAAVTEMQNILRHPLSARV